MKKGLSAVVSAIALVGVALAMPTTAGAADAAAKNGKTVTVCKHGCKYKSIQKAVDKTGKNATIKVKPGTYREGAIVEGKKHNGLTIMGTKKNPSKTVLQGKNAKSPEGLAQNGIEGIDVKKLKIKNLTAKNFATNGIFLRDSDLDAGNKDECKNYLVKNTHTSFNRSYGLYAFGCVGGRFTESTSTGHGDSAYYIGATPEQKNPKWTDLDNLEAYENVLGYSGTNSRYVDIHDNDFYNNGTGVVPSTLDSEPYEPSENGKIRKNNIFWNNYNYYLPDSPVKTVSNGLGQLGDLTINFPTGIGVVLFGASNWEVKNNKIFGNYKWGSAAFSDAVGNEGDDAVSTDNMFVNNQNGRNGTDPNAVDFFVDGSGSGNCFSGNSSSTFDPSSTASTASLYPGCPAPAPPASGTGTSAGDPAQFGKLADYVLSTPPENQQCSWTETPHPGFKDYEPSMVTPGPVCP